jgi:peroxiredoxin
MSDDRLRSAFRLLDTPLDPHPAFAERLYESLAMEAGFRGATARRRPWRWGTLVPAWRTMTPAMRLVYLAAVAALLLAALIGTGLAARLILAGPSAAEIVAASQRVQQDPPAYLMTIEATDPLRRYVISFDGHGAWRWDRLVEPELAASAQGAYEIHADGKVGRFDPTFRTWSVIGDELRLVENGTWLSWIEVVPYQPGSSIPWISCDSWERLDDEVVAGRPAYHLRCDGREFWVDTTSLLLVGMSSPQGSEGAGVSGMATALEIDPRFSSDTFALTAPVGAQVIDQNNPPASLVLRVGEPAPSLTATYLDGRVLDTSLLSLPAAIYAWAPWCPPCTGSTLEDLQAVAGGHPEITTIAIAWDQLGTVTGYVTQHPLTVPLAYDDANSMMGTWALNGIPALVLLDRDGKVAAVDVGPLTRADLEAMFSALAAGGPIPSPLPTPVRSPEPPPPSPAPGATEVVSGLSTGEVMPQWSGPLAAGGTFQSSSLVGRPAAIWFFTGGTCDGCPLSELESFAATAASLGSSASFVVISSGEPTPGWTRDLLAKLGIKDLPVVLDFDGAVVARLEMNIYGTLLLDAQGQVVEVVPGLMDPETMTRRLLELAKDAATSP